jgi:hypothetical protein
MTSRRTPPPAAPRAADPDTLPVSRPTRARLQTCFLRHFQNCGSVSEAAARAGIARRTVQRWRTENPAFAARYGAVLAGRLEILEDLAMRRATVAERRPVLHRGKQVATVERHNDGMLMRLLARFDRARLRQRLPKHYEAEVERRVAEEAERLQRKYEYETEEVYREFEQAVAETAAKRIAEMSHAAGQAGPAGAAEKSAGQGR